MLKTSLLINENLQRNLAAAGALDEVTETTRLAKITPNIPDSFTHGLFPVSPQGSEGKKVEGRKESSRYQELLDAEYNKVRPKLHVADQYKSGAVSHRKDSARLSSRRGTAGKDQTEQPHFMKPTSASAQKQRNKDETAVHGRRTKQERESASKSNGLTGEGHSDFEQAPEPRTRLDESIPSSDRLTVPNLKPKMQAYMEAASSRNTGPMSKSMIQTQPNKLNLTAKNPMSLEFSLNNKHSFNQTNAQGALLQALSSRRPSTGRANQFTKIVKGGPSNMEQRVSARQTRLRSGGASSRHE